MSKKKTKKKTTLDNREVSLELNPLKTTSFIGVDELQSHIEQTNPESLELSKADSIDEFNLGERNSPSKGKDLYGKSLKRDPNDQSTASRGYFRRPGRITNALLQHMASKNSIIAIILKTYENKVLAFCKRADLAKDGIGFKVVHKNEERVIEELMQEMQQKVAAKKETSSEGIADANMKNASNDSDKEAKPMQEDEIITKFKAFDSNLDGELSATELRRYAKMEMLERSKQTRVSLEESLMTCGNLKDRPYDLKKWNMGTMCKALIRDSLIYDLIALEIVPTREGKIHHWYPVDANTIRISSPALKLFKTTNDVTGSMDNIIPAKEMAALEKPYSDALILDPQKQKNEEYKYVQIFNDLIVRAFTPEELAVGIRNITTDIMYNGYGIPELETLTAIVTSHLYTENYNTSYFTQGFSAKGILHLKSGMNKKRLSDFRAAWDQMVSGGTNSFRTPFISGQDDIKWIPLTQSHSDMEFGNWLNYLIKVMSGVYQIDPAELGFGMREEGGKGTGGLGGDQLSTKLEASHSKGLIPLLHFLENFVTNNILDELNPDYKLEFIGLNPSEEEKRAAERETKSKYCITINEARDELGLPPIELGNIVQSPPYIQIYTEFSKEALAKAQREAEAAQDEQAQAGEQQGQEQDQATQQSFEEDFQAGEEEDQENLDKFQEEYKELQDNKKEDTEKFEDEYKEIQTKKEEKTDKETNKKDAKSDKEDDRNHQKEEKALDRKAKTDSKPAKKAVKKSKTIKVEFYKIEDKDEE